MSTTSLISIVKTTFAMALSLLLFSMLVMAFKVEAAGSVSRTWTVDDDKPADFQTIQEAIDHASEGDTVYVKAGTYYGEVYVGRSLQLVGEDKATAIIDANTTAQSATEGIYVAGNAEKVIIRDLTIRGGYTGILLLNDFAVVSNSIITGNDCGIVIRLGNRGHVISGNEIISNWQDGVYMRDVYDSEFYGNNIERNGRCGVWAGYCYGNTFVANTFSSNTYGLSFTEGSANNSVFHNNFIGNTNYQATVVEGGSNVWNDSYAIGGNYWCDYFGNDTCSGPCQNVSGSDGIGDIPYAIGGNNTDRYPLISLCNPSGDLNLDMRVDSADMSIFVLAFGSQPRNLEWNPLADLNNDNSVDIYDAILLAGSYRKQWM